MPDGCSGDHIPWRQNLCIKDPTRPRENQCHTEHEQSRTDKKRILSIMEKVNFIGMFTVFAIQLKHPTWMSYCSRQMSLLGQPNISVRGKGLKQHLLQHPCLLLWCNQVDEINNRWIKCNFAPGWRRLLETSCFCILNHDQDRM